MDDKIAILLEGGHHCNNFRKLLDQIGKSYSVYGDAELKEKGWSPTELVNHLKQNGTEVLISAGQYGENAFRDVNIPVVMVKRSKFAFAVAVKEAKKYSNNIAIIGRKGVFLDAALQFKSMFNENIDVESFETESDIPKCLEYLKTRGVNLLITGSRGRKYASTYGFRCVSVPFEQEDMLAAIKEAEHILTYLESRLENTEMLKTIQNSVSEGVIALDSSGNIIEINDLALSFCNVQKSKILEKKLDETCYKAIAGLKTFQNQQSVSDELLTIRGQRLSFSFSPIWVSQKYKGYLIIFSIVEQVQQKERDLRAKLYSKGHIAHYTFDKIIGCSHSIQENIAQAKKYAKVDSSILITGHSGSGKEVFAQSIHNASKRKDYPFVVINCGALTESLLESILFGYEKGAYTGAAKEGRQGLFEIAHGGTVFLDEIAEMSLNLQTRFLRVLQEKEVTPIGSDRVIPVNVRIIAATNRDMQKRILDGHFREDLFYRVAVLLLKTAPLSQRKDDCKLLIKHFLQSKAQELELDEPSITSEALEYLCSLNYIGNIRQLSNIVERLIVLSDDQDISLELVMSSIETSMMVNNELLIEQTDERRQILQLIEMYQGNRVVIANAMNISTTTLWRKMKKYNLLT